MRLISSTLLVASLTLVSAGTMAFASGTTNPISGETVMQLTDEQMCVSRGGAEELLPAISGLVEIFSDLTWCDQGRTAALEVLDYSDGQLLTVQLWSGEPFSGYPTLAGRVETVRSIRQVWLDGSVSVDFEEVRAAYEAIGDHTEVTSDPNYKAKCDVAGTGMLGGILN